jgi:beta-glucosidase
LTFTIGKRDLASFDEESSSWIAEPGEYVIRIGASSEDIRQTVPFTLKKGITVKTESRALLPERPIERLSAPVDSSSPKS